MKPRRAGFPDAERFDVRGALKIGQKAPMTQLHFITGPLAGKRAVLSAKRVSIGRKVGCSIRINDASISPRHLVLHRDGGTYILQIDDSHPPVAVNGKQVVKSRLHNGDHLQIGAIQATFSADAAAQAAPNPLDFHAVPATPQVHEDDAELDLHDDHLTPRPPSLGGNGEKDARGKGRGVFLALFLLFIMFGGSALLFRKDLWPAPAPKPVAQVEKPKEEEKPLPKEEPIEVPVVKIEEPKKIDTAFTGKVHRTRTYKSHQEAVDAARPGDSVIFDSADAKPIVVEKPIRDVQFISGIATWEVHADLIDCQFIYHETKQFLQNAGKMERSVFFRCPMKQTHLTHADAVSFYFDERSPLHPKDNPDGGKSPILLLTGFVRDVLIHKPHSGPAAIDRRFEMRWGPAIRIHATDPVGDGRGTYIMSPVVNGQRAWTPHEISRGSGVTYAHLTADNSLWADPVLDILRGEDCVVLCTAFAGEVPTTIEQYATAPRLIKYHDHSEYGHDLPGPAFRGAAMTIMGRYNRIVAHGDARKPWTVNRKMTLPGLHYADGIIASDPYIKQYATEQGGLSIDFAAMKNVFIMQPSKTGAEFLTFPTQENDEPSYPIYGPDLHKPVFITLKDLRVNAGEFDKMQLLDLTGKTTAEIEKALVADRSIFLGPGTYEFKTTLKAGFIVGAGMERTILKWPDEIDCSQRNCRGMINCTVSGGRDGYNSQLGTAGRIGNPIGLFLRTRFLGQADAGVNLHTSLFQTWQDCEFIGGKHGFTHGLDKGPVAYKGDKGATGGTTIDSLNICNCTFRQIKQRAIDLNPNSPQLGHVGIHHCTFDEIGHQAIRIEGGQTHLVQNCKFGRCGLQDYVPAVSITSNGVLALSHLDIDCSLVKGNTLAVSLKGLAAVSHCNIKGLPGSLKCNGLLTADHVIADGTVQANPDSLFCRCQFTNMNLPMGTAIAKEKDFTDVTASAPASIPDKTPPPEVTGVKVRTVGKQRRIEWNPVEDPESGISYYIILSEGKEVGRTPFTYEPPSDIHSPIQKTAAPSFYLDSNLMNRGYEVLAVNGAGVTSLAAPAAPRRLGPARARFLNMDGAVINIKDIPNVKGKVTQIVDEDGKSILIENVGIKGMPNLVFFEWGDVVEGP
ncbi:MAG: FHA domain-containing protein [Planctomycetes bacterium]|nr:FHA domain-containing protein [Planctomycetota bacterium]